MSTSESSKSSRIVLTLNTWISKWLRRHEFIMQAHIENEIV